MRNSELQRQRAKENMTTHGMFGTRLYTIWASVNQRCKDPKCTAYKDYGAKGTSVCKEWETFEPFMEWAISNGYSDTLTIDRILSTGKYEPSNCRWVDTFTQSQNRQKPKSNTSGYSGVWLEKDKWRAMIGINKKRHHLGYFETALDACKARDLFIINNNLNHPLQVLDKGTFSWALDLMKYSDAKVRRDGWDKKYFIYINSVGTMYWRSDRTGNCGECDVLTANDILANDWEIYDY